MDYEKKYKEALEKARQLCAYPTTKPFTSDLQDIFPELAESEGERIRKTLIKLVKKAGEGYENVIDGVSIENAIAWLEKQGEQSKKHDVCDTCDEKDSCISPCCVKLVEEQGGQKPVNLVTILDDYFANTPKEQQDKDWEELKHLNGFGCVLVEQKLAWSEWDRILQDSSISYLCNLRDTFETKGWDKEQIQKCINWLKSLRPKSH